MQTIDNTLRLRTYTIDRKGLRRQYIPPILRIVPAGLAGLVFSTGILITREFDTWVILVSTGATLVLFTVILALVLPRTMKKVLLTSLEIDDQSVTWMSGTKVRNRIWRNDVERISFSPRKIDIRPRGKSERLRIPRKYFSEGEFRDIGEQLRLWTEVPTG